MGAGYTRRVSFNERLYLAAQRLGTPLFVQIAIEGEGALQASDLEAAVARAAEANPGSKLVRRGVLGWTRWVSEGPVPPVRVVSPANDTPDVIEIPLPSRAGPTCEVVLVTAPSRRVVFRCFHGVMDARGLLHFAEDVFRALRGEALVGAPSTLTDSELVRELGGKRDRPVLKSECEPLAGAPLAPSRRVVWKRLTLHGPMPALVARISSLLAAHRAAASVVPTRIMIPVDVRNYRKDVRSTGNLSNPLFLDVAKGQGWRDVHKAVLKGLMKREALKLDPADAVGPWLPMALLTVASALWTGWQRRRGLYPLSALVTHLALQSTAQFSGGGFTCRALYFLPPQSDLLPLCISAVSHEREAEVVVSGPVSLLGDGRLERLCEAIERGLAADGAG